MKTAIEALDKADCIINTLLEDYGIFDIQNPTDEQKLIYSTDCGRIHAFISIISDCVTKASDELREVCAHE